MTALQDMSPEGLLNEFQEACVSTQPIERYAVARGELLARLRGYSAMKKERDMNITNGDNWGHTREEVMRLVSDAFEKWHCQADDLYIAVQRIVDVRISESRKKAFREELAAEHPWETEDSK